MKHFNRRQVCLALTSFVALPYLASSAGAQTPGATEVQEFVYKKTPQGDLKLFVHRPAGAKAGEKRPGIVFFFGGGWRAGNPNQFLSQAEHFARRGMVAARADYRVQQRHKATPDQCVEDAKSAIRWFRGHAATLGVDPDRIVGAGGSAGGHLAACSALVQGFEATGEEMAVSSRPNALLLYNPVCDLSTDRLMEMLRDRLPGENRAEKERLAKQMSPNLHLRKDAPPALLLFGDQDNFLPDARVFVARSKELGNRADLFLAEGAGHGFFNRPPWQERTTRRADEFLVSLGYLTPEK